MGPAISHSVRGSEDVPDWRSAHQGRPGKYGARPRGTRAVSGPRTHGIRRPHTGCLPAARRCQQIPPEARLPRPLAGRSADAAEDGVFDALGRMVTTRIEGPGRGARILPRGVPDGMV